MRFFRRKTTKLFLCLIAVVSLVSCQSEDSGTKVLIFSDMSEDMKNQLLERAFKQNQAEWDIRIFPVIPEKLLVEITAKEGDLMIVPEEMFRTYDDPEGFQRLEEFSLNKKPLGPYTTKHPKTGEEIDYAIKIPTGTKTLNGYSFRLNREMVAFIPIYAEKSKEALSLIKQLRENRSR
ncbi:lipoprotein YteS [Bacillus sp. NPDC077027]|uniref:lipoprotein YteS n=1 Tax=Bacillus sp. NPDC077027 TaxID=3390548 RepID=UPI003D06E32C